MEVWTHCEYPRPFYEWRVCLEIEREPQRMYGLLLGPLPGVTWRVVDVDFVDGRGLPAPQARLKERLALRLARCFSEDEIEELLDNCRDDV